MLPHRANCSSYSANGKQVRSILNTPPGGLNACVRQAKADFQTEVGSKPFQLRCPPLRTRQTGSLTTAYAQFSGLLPERPFRRKGFCDYGKSPMPSSRIACGTITKGKNILGSSSLFHYLHKHKAIAVLPNGADGWSVPSGSMFVPYSHAFLDF